MVKYLYFCVSAICIITVAASSLSSAKEDLKENKDKPEDFVTTTEANVEPVRVLDIPNPPTETIKPESTAVCEAISKPSLKQPRISETKNIKEKENEEEMSNEVHSRERRPSLVERLIHHKDYKDDRDNQYEGRDPVPCTCGVFLSGQFKKGSKKQPKGLPVLTQEMDTPFMNNAVGNRQCTNKCLELIIKHLPKSGEIICATVDREHVFKERAYLFVKNHSDKWHGTNLSAGREFCCEDNVPYKCPIS